MSDKTIESELNIKAEFIDLLEQIAGSRKGSIGSIDNVYLPQLSRKRIDNLLDAIKSERTSEANGEVRPLEGIVSGKALIDELKKLKKDECQCCGDLDEAIWKECGCHIEGINEGLTIAISKIQKAL